MPRLHGRVFNPPDLKKTVVRSRVRLLYALKGCLVYLVISSFLVLVLLSSPPAFSRLTRKLSLIAATFPPNRAPPHEIGRTVGADSPLVGVVWPRPFNETNFRLRSQIRFMLEYIRKSKSSNVTRRLKTIVRVGDFNFYNFVDGETLFLTDGIPSHWCTVTSNQSAAPTADALIISEFGFAELERFGSPKPANQIWIAQHHEGPRYNRIDPRLLRDKVNWTASYRRDSTIFTSSFYGHYEPVGGVSTSPAGAGGAGITPAGEGGVGTTATVAGVNYAAGKTKKVAWMVSNCRAGNDRAAYARELARHIAVDVYGNCGTHRCPTHARQRAECAAWLGGAYKFYLAFENAHCRDYITEKLFDNALKNGMIPIVMGPPRSDYLAAAPPHSFIHIDDFPSPRALAEYLRQLDADDNRYNEYMAWRGTMALVRQHYWGRLCALLHLQGESGYAHWYTDYALWWNDACELWDGGVWGFVANAWSVWYH